jgi:hypothetical protein
LGQRPSCDARDFLPKLTKMFQEVIITSKISKNNLLCVSMNIKIIYCLFLKGKIF